jgi:elongation factor P
MLGPMISTGDVKKGVIIELDGQLMKVLDWTHIKMARGSAQVRMKLQNVRRGDIVERTFQAGTRWPRARVDQRKVQYLYTDGDAYHFMDNETYDQFTVRAAMLGDDARFMKDNTEVFVSMYDGEVLGVDLPVTVDLTVTQTDPGFAGDTATGAKKAARLETGLVVQVPLFVNEGDTLRIDTRNGEYVTRVQ